MVEDVTQSPLYFSIPCGRIGKTFNYVHFSTDVAVLRWQGHTGTRTDLIPWHGAVTEIVPIQE